MLVKPCSRDQLDMAIKLEHWDQQVEHFGFFKKQTTAYNDFFSSLTLSAALCELGGEHI